MCGGVVEDIGSGISDAVSGVGDAVGGAIESVGQAIGDVGVFIDESVNQLPGGWITAGGLAAGGAYGLASLGTEAAMASAVASADATAAGLGFSSAAEAISAGAITAEGLGLPAATTIADLGGITSSASAGYLGLGEAAGAAASSISPEIIAAANASADPIGTLASMTGMTTEAASAFTPEMIAAANASKDPIGMLAAMSNMTPAELAAATGPGAGATSTLSNILGYAKTAAPIIGGLGKLAGGVMSMQAGKQMKQYGAAADPNSPYRAGYASQLYNLIQNPSTVTTTPGYQFNLAQGLQGLQAQQAAQGRLVSGGALIQAQQFGQNMASQSYSDQVKTLAGLSGATQSPATGAIAQAGLAGSALGATYGGWNSVAGGAGQFGTGLLNLYENYNRPSPNPLA
jgi:hypothetical protein